ncbi:MAG: hypothetical protein US92_C0002G0001 [Candidatus Peregrinibacteria bacterium GW2011_GWA2_38_36]|nr:MAG: hypothetical protein US92_C0002G0001 [Candidatus Peregrinibacteria bacterium GW2011_GWA2_38_36]
MYKIIPMINHDQQEYEQTKQLAINFFTNNKEIKSLCFGNIRLNNHGLFHLIFKNKNCKRDLKNQIKRFQLLQYIKPVLENMKYYQEYLEKIENIKVKNHGLIDFRHKIVKYWAFIAIINNRIRIKIILKKIGNGEIFFWSIIPYWKTKHYKDIKFISLHKGNLNED